MLVGWRKRFSAKLECGEPARKRILRFAAGDPRRCRHPPIRSRRHSISRECPRTQAAEDARSTTLQSNLRAQSAKLCQRTSGKSFRNALAGPSTAGALWVLDGPHGQETVASPPMKCGPSLPLRLRAMASPCCPIGSPRRPSGTAGCVAFLPATPRRPVAFMSSIRAADTFRLWSRHSSSLQLSGLARSGAAGMTRPRLSVTLSRVSPPAHRAHDCSPPLHL